MELPTQVSTGLKDSQLPLVLVDDDQTILRAHRVTLETNGWDFVKSFYRSEDALSYYQHNSSALLLLDVRMPGLSGFDLAKYVRGTHPEIPIIIISGVSDVQIAIEFMKLGCFDYLVKPVDPMRFVTTVQRALEFRDLKNALQSVAVNTQNQTVYQQESNSGVPSPLGFVTNNPTTFQAFQYAHILSGGWEPILLRGETGTGKDLAARAIHRVSGRNGDFIPVNISGLDDALFSDTLFGHARGAYTHAEGKREGLIAKAKKGTIFLDEIGDLDQKNQIKLLRLLENREYYSLGSDTPQICEARILMATHRNLEEMVDSGQFRKDLYYRISTFQVHLPPLRSRREDIPYLSKHFLQEAFLEKRDSNKSWVDQGETRNSASPDLSSEVYHVFDHYDFPGNIRELRSIMYRAFTHAQSVGRGTINLGDLDGLTLPIQQSRGILESGQFSGKDAQSTKGTPQSSLTTKPMNDSSFLSSFSNPALSELLSDMKQLPTLEQMNQELVAEALKRSLGNRSLAARYLGITPQALHQRLKRKESE